VAVNATTNDVIVYGAISLVVITVAIFRLLGEA
jgi:hypothetical protein